MFHRLGRAAGVRAAFNPPKARRHGAVLILRQWTRPAFRTLMEQLPLHLCYGELQPHDSRPLSVEELFEAYNSEFGLPLIIQYLRAAEREQEIETFMEMLPDWGRDLRELWANMGRLMLRRFVLGDSAAAIRELQARQSSKREAERRLKRKHAQARALSMDKAQLQAHQRDLKQLLKRTRNEAEALVIQARDEVAAAKEALAERVNAHARELDEQADQHQARMTHLRERLAAGRTQFAAALATWQTAAGTAPFTGHTISVDGDDRNREGHKRLIESAGGRMVQEAGSLQVKMNAGEGKQSTPGLFHTEESGLAAFERLLWRRMLPSLFQGA